MDSTSISLLARVKNTADAAAWARFVELYAPLLYCWAEKHGVSSADAADLVQDILTTLAAKLPEFEYDPKQRFRGWLHTITRNRAMDWHRRRSRAQLNGLSGFVEALADKAETGIFEEEEFRQFIVHRIRDVMQSEFEHTTWEAFWQNVAEGKSAREVADEIGISENAVRLAKYRVVKRLREEFAGLLP